MGAAGSKGYDLEAVFSKIGKSRTVPIGTILIRQGEPCDQLFLLHNQARRLQSLTQAAEEEKDVVVNQTTDAPTTLLAIATNPAYRSILHRYIAKQPAKKLLAAQLEFVAEQLRLLQAPVDASLIEIARKMYADFIAPKGSKGPRHLPGLSAKLRAQLEADLKAVRSNALDEARHVFDGVALQCSRSLDADCLPGFIGDTQYKYILELRVKEKQRLELGAFELHRPMAEGQFGQVLIVTKRDSGRKYVLKTLSKERVATAFEEGEGRKQAKDWAAAAAAERQLQTLLHHPLVVNVAFAMQTADSLILVSDDVCLVDLGQCIDEGTPFNAAQIRLVASEVVAAIGFIHSKFVLYRDLKPENIFIDSDGHIRLNDFSMALLGDGKMPIASEIAGSCGHMAPEVLGTAISNTGVDGALVAATYSAAADWWTVGVLLYELVERKLPFSDTTEYNELQAEYGRGLVMSSLRLSPDPVHHITSRLLEWKEEKRLGSQGGAEQVKSHPYWRAVDWAAANERRGVSPLRDYRWWRSAYSDAAADEPAWGQAGQAGLPPAPQEQSKAPPAEGAKAGFEDLAFKEDATTGEASAGASGAPPGAFSISFGQKKARSTRRKSVYSSFPAALLKKSGEAVQADRAALTAKAKKVFEACDDDASGALDRKELVGALAKLGYAVDTKQTIGLLEKLGISGAIDGGDFVKLAHMLDLVRDKKKKEEKPKGAEKKRTAAVLSGGDPTHVPGWDFVSAHAIADEFLAKSSAYASIM